MAVLKMPSVWFLALLVLTACGTGEEGGQDLAAGDSWSQDHQISDVPGSVDERGSPDSRGGDEGSGSGDVAIDIPAFELPPPLGNRMLGEECSQDGDCVDNLCWSTQQASGCTFACSTQQECQAFGLSCLPIRAGVNACVPLPSDQIPCSGHEDCDWPMVCVGEFSWCDLPECTLDADCPSGKQCEPGVRRCQPVTCQSAYECPNPSHFCLEGVCSKALCTRRDQCPSDSICSYAQGFCAVGTPCNQEGACNFYNQICVDGLCEPNLCATPCANEAHVCLPRTGKCGPPCEAPGQCSSGWACDEVAGACYQSVHPVAVAVEKGTGLPQANLSGAASIVLDGSGSYDRDGPVDAYRWQWVSASTWSWFQTGVDFCFEATCTIQNPAPGLYQAGLRVRNRAGLWSIQSVVTLFVWD